MAIRFGEFAFDDEARELTRGGRVVPLTPKAFQLLQILIDRRPKAVSKGELIERLWPDVSVEEANVRNLIAEIRAALQDRDRNKPLIRTLPRFGYAFAEAGTAARSPARLLTATESYELGFGDNLIGRDPNCAVMLDRHGVSRHHARIRITDAIAYIQDLGSKNGTWLNETRIAREELLKDGDTVRVGSQTLRFRKSSPRDSTDSMDAQSNPKSKIQNPK